MIRNLYKKGEGLARKGKVSKESAVCRENSTAKSWLHQGMGKARMAFQPYYQAGSSSRPVPRYSCCVADLWLLCYTRLGVLLHLLGSFALRRCV